MMNSTDYDYLFRIILIGNASCGKSSTLVRFVEDDFKGHYQATIGLDFKIKTFSMDGKNIKLQIWDTAGQETFRTVTCSYYKGASGVIIFYDITDKPSFKALKGWFAEMEKYCSESACKILVGNKTDLERLRQVPYSEGKTLADELGIKFIEASAKDAVNINEIFQEITREMIKQTKVGSKGFRQGNEVVLLPDKSQETDKGSCC